MLKNEIKKSKELKIFFVTDFGTEFKDDLESLLIQLEAIGIYLEESQIIHKEYLQAALTGSFDILFFDWGGMSIGNSLLERFCEHLINDAEEHPSRTYIMASHFTGYAMKDALSEFREKPANIIVDMEEQAEMVRAIFS